MVLYHHQLRVSSPLHFSSHYFQEPAVMRSPCWTCFSSPISSHLLTQPYMSEPGLPICKNRRLPGPQLLGHVFSSSHVDDKAIIRRNRLLDSWEPSVTMCPMLGMFSLTRLSSWVNNKNLSIGSRFSYNRLVLNFSKSDNLPGWPNYHSRRLSIFNILIK
jgi:hypothetical protein